MVEDDQYCVDILKQSYAVERALKAFASALLEGHLGSCVPAGFKEGRDAEMIRELGEEYVSQHLPRRCRDVRNSFDS